MEKRKKGVAYARENMAKKSYYQGYDSESNEEEDRKVNDIVVQVLQLGFVVSTSVLLSEIILHSISSRLNERRCSFEAVAYRISRMRSISNPTVYPGDFRTAATATWTTLGLSGMGGRRSSVFYRRRPSHRFSMP